VGRGRGSGHGKTSCRGQKGAKARGQIPLGFEGGQTPLHRRLPLRRGFRNHHGLVYAVVNVAQLETLEGVDTVTPELLLEQRVVRKMLSGVKILGDGDLSRPITVRAHRFSESAVQKIEAAGGKVEVI